MAGDIFGISISALNAAQTGLATTEHNIANANTTGYSRQVAVASTRQAQATGSGFIGQGVDITSVKRIYDEFLSNQVVREQGQASHLSSYYSQIQQINNMLADPNAGLSPALQDFFSAVNGVSNAPEAAATRQTMLSSAQSLASRFQSMNQRMVDINDSINGQITASVASINSYAQQIATLNLNIVVAQASSGGRPPNDLLDQRDQLIAELNQEVKTSVVKQDDGSLNVSVGSGQLLVVSGQAYSLQTVQSLGDPTKLEVAAGTAGGTVIRLQQSAFQGGKLGGMITFRSESLDPAQNSLGLVAMGLAGTFNQQHQLGQDLYGVLGADFFVQPVPAVSSYTNNTGNAAVGASVSSYAGLTGSDYTLMFNGAAGYTLTRLSDNKATNYAALPQTVDGLTISVTSGAPNAGDTFLIRPTKNGAAHIAVAFTDPSKIAAAAPLRTNATLTNIGTGRISLGTVNAPPPGTVDPAHPLTDLNLQQAVSITFTSPTTFNVTGTGAGIPAVGVPYTAGDDITYNGWTVQITGVPRAGDSFTVGANNNAPTDNRNVLLLAALQNQKTLSGGTVNYQGAYSQLVSQVGNKTRELQVASAAQDTMVAQTIQAQQAVSGVNLDEEAANLLRYQRAYQAAGKAMQIANTLFDTLLSLGR
ncbi:Flagellar hook-associated protein 1 [Gallionellaceae bacterium]|nr:Flagellar hook-associated protein 1 [Gallionellaceae bacterium]